MPSKKDSESTSPRLFNFLYRDQDTLNSYYAQAFNGVIRSVQQGKTRTTNKTHKTTPLSVATPLFKYTHERLISASESDTQYVDPHDIVTLDILQWLEETGFIKHDITQIQKTSFVKITGDAFFIDQKLLTSSLVEGIKMLERENSPISLPDGALTLIIPAMNVMREILLGPSVLLAKENIVVLGDLKEAYLSAPITSRYMVAGGKFMASVTMVGLVTENIPYNAPSGSVLNGFTNLANGLSTMFSQVATHLIQPVVIYQEITP